MALTSVRTAAKRNLWDEQIHARLPLLLTDTGKQAEAIGVYQQLRRNLAETLGVDPGAQLRDVYSRSLRQDAKLAAVPPMPRRPGPVRDGAAMTEEMRGDLREARNRVRRSLPYYEEAGSRDNMIIASYLTFLSGTTEKSVKTVRRNAVYDRSDMSSTKR
jgi:hypothetical protein